MRPLRLQRVRELLKREIGEIIRREFPVSESGILTVNDVEVSNDLHLATVFLGFVGTQEQRTRSFNVLRDERKRIQGILAQSVVLKYTPQLKFVIDESVARGDRVIAILEELERSSPDNERSPEDH